MSTLEWFMTGISANGYSPVHYCTSSPLMGRGGWRISAGQAGFDLKNRKIVFRDRVRASAGKESWTGDERSIDPASGRVTGKRKGETTEYEIPSP